MNGVRPARVDPQGGGSILVVDDSPSDLQSLTTMLTGHGYDVQGARDGPTALQIASTAPPDLLMVDVALPGMDGYQVCRCLKEEAATQEVPVILLSPTDEVVNKAHGFAAGCADHLDRPFHEGEVLARVGAHLALWRLQKQLQQESDRRLRSESERDAEHERMRESEARLQSLVANVPDVLWTTDSQGNTVFISPSIEKVYGYTPEEVCEAGAALWLERIHAEDYQAVLDAYSSLFAHNIKFDIEYRIQRKDGRWIWLHDRAVSTYEQDGVVYADGVFTDITARREAEDALQRAHEELELTVQERTAELRTLSAVVEQTASSIAIIDREGKVEYANRAFLELNQFSPEEVVAKNWRSFVSMSSSLRERYPEIQKTVLVEGAMWKGEIRDRAKSGESVWREATLFPIRNERGEITHTVYMSEDITGRKRAEEALREEKAFTEAALDSQRDTFFVFDPSSGRAIRWNRAFREATGYSDEEIASMNAPDSWYGEADLARAAAAVETILREGQATLTMSLVTKEKGSIPFEYVASAFQAPGAKGPYIIAVGRDVAQRMAAEQALRESEERFRQFFENAPEYCYMVSPQGLIVDVNRAALKALGYQKEELVGRPLRSLYAPESLPRMEQLFARWGETGELRDEEMIIATKHGDRRTVLLSASVLRDEAGRVTNSVSVQKDITERVQAESQRDAALRALRRSERKFRSVIEQSSDGIVLIAEHGSVAEWNRGMEGITGLKRSEALGRPFWEVQLQLAPEGQHTADRFETMRAATLEFLRTGQAPWADGIVEQELQRPDGTARVIQSSVFPIETEEGIWLGSISRDVTEQMRAEQALRESETRFRALAAATFEGIAFSEHGRVTDANQQMAHILGYELSELVGAEVSRMVAPEDRELVRSKILSGSEEPYEHRSVRKDGSIIFVEVRARMMPIDGRPVRVTAVRDITERKKAEEALRESEERSRNIIESIPLGMHMYELRAGSALVLTGANPAADQILGVDNQQFASQTIEEAFPPLAETEVPERYRAAAAEAQAWHTEQVSYEHGRIRGAFEVHAFQTSPGKMVAAFQDVTERKKAEEALRRYAERLRILSEIDRGILAARSAEAIAQFAVSRVRGLVACRRVGVSLFDYAANEIEVLAVDTDTETGLGKGARMPLEPFRQELEASDQGRVFVWQVSPSKGRDHETLSAEGIRSCVTVPLMVRDELIGSLNLGLAEFDSGKAFIAESEDVVRQVADQLAIAIQQARLYEQIEKHAAELEQRVSDRTRELSVLFEVAALASQSLDLETTLSQSLEQVLEAVGSDAGVVHLLDEPGGTWSDGMPAEQVLRLAAHRGVPPDLVAAFESLPATEGLGGWIMEHYEPLIMQDLASDPRGKIELPTAYPLEAYSYVGIPLRAGGRTEGVLGVVRRRDQPQLNVEELSLLASIADQLGVAVESARLRRRAEQAAVLEERERLARDLHDSVSQLLYSMNLFAKSGRNAYNLGDMDELDHCLTELGEAGQQALREMRLLLYELRPRLLEQEGLAGALEHRLDAVERRVGIAAQLLRREVVDLPSEVERDLYHIATEALNNSLKHGQATAVEVSIDVTLERVYLEVSDNGIGYDPGAIEGKGGLGILGMRERAKRLGGTLQVRSAPGEGTRVRIELASDRGDSEQL